ncbi:MULTISPECIES: hypothetical protein [unclassified Synechocystis]|uniref:hypothetical protein n=1 Tax=unclassified Synechocystis TaxID=2640012 RepID=UPI001CBF7A88|nr:MULTISPECIES: hypothetical protein [unclassified Synechocystis]
MGSNRERERLILQKRILKLEIERLKKQKAHNHWSKKDELSDLTDTAMGAASIAAGTAAGVATSSVVGGMGLAVTGTAVGIGVAPVAAAGAVVGSAAYGVKKAIDEQDATAIGAAVVGAGVGAGAASVIGGMGLAVAGTAVGITMAPVAAAGAVVGLAGYGVSKLFEGKKRKHHKKRQHH